MIFDRIESDKKINKDIYEEVTEQTHEIPTVDNFSLPHIDTRIVDIDQD
jgi:hypothetical protein